MERDMAMRFHKFFAAALLGGTMCVAGPSFAAKSTATGTATVQHKATNASLKHRAPAKAATNVQQDSKERSTTAELNRASLAKAASGQTSANDQPEAMQQAMLDDEADAAGNA